MDPVERADREAYIIERRRHRVTFDKIGEELGISLQRVHAIYKTACNRHPTAELAQIRHEEGELLDRAIVRLLAIAESEELRNSGEPLVTPHARVEAWNAIIKASESKRKLMGADAPAKKEVTVLTEDVMDAALRREMEEFELKAKELDAIEARANSALAELEAAES